MFISKKKWNDLQNRVAALEESNQCHIPGEKIRDAMRTALSNAQYRFEYELTRSQEAGPAVPFSTRPKQDSAP